MLRWQVSEQLQRGQTVGGRGAAEHSAGGERGAEFRPRHQHWLCIRCLATGDYFLIFIKILVS